MNELTVMTLEPESMARVLSPGPDVVTCTDEMRRSLTDALRHDDASRRRVDAWGCEGTPRRDEPFQWSARSARRLLGNAAVREQFRAPDLSVFDALELVLEEHLIRVANGFARPGSLGHWTSTLSDGARTVVIAEAASWAQQLWQLGGLFSTPWQIPVADSYYDVASARVTLRGRRDMVIVGEEAAILVRIRSGAPGSRSGTGLRVDLATHALAHPRGLVPTRMVGFWPDAGLAMSVDGTEENVHAGIRAIVKSLATVPLEIAA